MTDSPRRSARTPAIEQLIEEVRSLLARDALFSLDRVRISTVLELVDDELLSSAREG